MLIETFTTPNAITKSGLPLRWRWRIVEDDKEVLRGPYSFRTEAKALANVTRNVEVPTGSIVRRPEHDDAPWIPVL